MDTTKTEKDWIKRINGKNTVKERAAEVAREKPAQQAPQKAEKGRGFDDIAGMNDLKQFVREGFINVLKHRECAKAYGIKPPALLFYGPAGCGKTYFAEKMAEEVGIHFMKVVPDDLACTWVHGTQQKIGELFRDAEKKGPTLLFFDEFDAMVPRRSGNEANQHYDSEVNEFLCMLNNAAERGVYVLAATNHPERIDKAVLRTGRIDELVYIDMPDVEARKNLFALALSKLPADEGIDTARLAALTAGYNCSDISYIVQAAARKMFNASIQQADGTLQRIGQSLLEAVIAAKSPSVSSRDLREYERVRNEFAPKDKKQEHAAVGFR